MILLVKINIDINEYGIDLADVTEEAVNRTVILAAEDLRTKLQDNSPQDTTDLMKSWYVLGSKDKERIVKSDVQYAQYVNDGTGVYVGHGKIFPKKKGGVLGPFKYKGKMIAVKWIRGQKGQHFVEKSIAQTEARVEDFLVISLKGG